MHTEFSVNERIKVERVDLPRNGVVIRYRTECGRWEQLWFRSGEWCSVVTEVSAHPGDAEVHQQVTRIHEGGGA